LLVQAVIDDAPIDVRAITREVCPGTPEERADTLAVLTLLQEQLVDDPPPFRGSKVIQVEERLRMSIGPHIYEGTPDLVEAYGRTCVVTDWKTHWRPLSQEAFEADDQVPRYALLVDANHPDRFDRFVIRMRFVRYRGAVREIELERWQLAQVKWDLTAAMEEAELKLKRGDSSATPGDWCSICSRTDTCPVVRNYLAHGLDLTIEDDSAAEIAAATVRAIDAHSASLKRQLKRYLGADHPTGRVKLSGGTYGYGPSHHKKASVADVLDVWETFEQPLNKHVLRVDVDQLNRSLDRAPGKMRTAIRATIEEFDVADCRYRRGDHREEEART